VLDPLKRGREEHARAGDDQYSREHLWRLKGLTRDRDQLADIRNL